MSKRRQSNAVISRQRCDAVIFDLDGVVTKTARVHAAAWKHLFDEYREDRLKRDLSAYEPFDEDADYREYVDGKPRYDGIESFLRARGIEIPHGEPDDAPDKETICGLGNRKNELFNERLEHDGVQVYESTVRLILNLRDRGYKVAIISASVDEIGEIVESHKRRLAIFLDYDGTLTPIVAHPEAAVLSEEMRETIRRLARICPVAVVSGRDLADVRERVGLEEIVYAGSRGFDIAGPGGMRLENPEAQDFLSALDQAEAELREHLTVIEGAQVERKKYAIAIHFRNAEESRVGDIEHAVDAVGSKHPNLRKGHGKKIFELHPDVDWHKGRAVMWLLEALDLDSPDVFPLYLGDDVTDVTDEDAFRTLKGRGLGIVVRDEPRQTSAQYALENSLQVASFLNLIIAHLGATDKWRLVYEGFEPDQEGLREALCTLGNGYFATRGAAPESAADEVHYPGTYLAGGYNRLKTEIAGRVVENEDLVNLPNWLALSFRIADGGWFDLRKTDILFYRQELDLKAGVLSRVVRLRD